MPDWSYYTRTNAELDMGQSTVKLQNLCKYVRTRKTISLYTHVHTCLCAFYDDAEMDHI